MEDKEPNVLLAVPFFMVADILTSMHFYVDGLGFQLKIKWEPRGRIEWCWLQLGKASIMLQEHAKEGKHAVVYSENKKGTGVFIYFICRDAVALYHEFTERGIAATVPFVGNGNWVTGVIDPDGYQVYFESGTDVPEETNYSDWVKNQ